MEERVKAREPVEPVIESYWLKRKREREEKEIEEDKKALQVFKKACEFYAKNYPNSKYGVTYEGDKEELSEPSFTEVTREQAILFRTVLEYYKSEKQVIMSEVVYIGRALWRVNQSIPDLARINKIIALKEQKEDIEREVHKLENMKVEVVEKLKEPELRFLCHWCNKEFVGNTAREEIKEHILKCEERPNAPEYEEKEKEEEKLFECNLCGIKLNRGDMKDHAWKCKPIETVVKEEVKEVENSTEKHVCPQCGRDDFKSESGLKVHISKYCKKKTEEE